MHFWCLLQEKRMERDIWRVIVAALRRLPRRSSRGQQYSNAEVLAVVLWAALHDRSILWACRRSNWPVQAWRRRLPDQSTMSRRLRRPDVLDDLEVLLHMLQGADDSGSPFVLTDGKPLAVSHFSQDGDATLGWGAGKHERGYKLHVLAVGARRLCTHEVLPMNMPEAQATATLLARADACGLLRGKSVLLADASYDTNPLHAAAGRAGLLMLAPRRLPHRGLATNRGHDIGRVISMAVLEGGPEFAAWQKRARAPVEHYFAGLVTGAGLHALPPWVRTLTRVRVWVAAKVALNAARLTLVPKKVA
jgi:hypothetical protein